MALAEGRREPSARQANPLSRIDQRMAPAALHLEDEGVQDTQFSRDEQPSCLLPPAIMFSTQTTFLPLNVIF